jgi:hypothetical protein
MNSHSTFKNYQYGSKSIVATSSMHHTTDTAVTAAAANNYYYHSAKPERGLYQNVDSLNLRVEYDSTIDDEEDSSQQQTQIDGYIDEEEDDDGDLDINNEEEDEDEKEFYYEITKFNEKKSTPTGLTTTAAAAAAQSHGFQAINNRLYDDFTCTLSSSSGMTNEQKLTKFMNYREANYSHRYTHHHHAQFGGPSSNRGQQVTPNISSLNIISPWPNSTNSASLNNPSVGSHLLANHRIQEADYSTIRKVSRNMNNQLHLRHKINVEHTNQQVKASTAGSLASSSTPSSSSSSSPVTTTTSATTNNNPVVSQEMKLQTTPTIHHHQAAGVFVLNKPINVAPKPHFHQNANQQASVNSYFDAHLLTPLTPHSYSLKQIQNNTQATSVTNDEIDGEILMNSRIRNLKKLSSSNQPPVSIENISPPTLVPFNKFEYYNKLNRAATNANSESVNESSCSTVDEICSAANQHGGGSAKSASTSYLLSKISSLASLTMPKNYRGGNTTNDSINNTKSATSSPIQIAAASPSTNTTTTTTTNNSNLITKIFNRKSGGQGMLLADSPPAPTASTLLSSSSSVSIGNSPLVANSMNNMSGDNNMSGGQQQQQNRNIEKAVSKSGKIGSSVRAIKKSATKLNSTTTTTSYSNLPGSSAVTTSSSRRPFAKKRSQSIHNSSAEANTRQWFYNKVCFLNHLFVNWG